MNQTGISVVVGVIAGVAGALIVGLVGGSKGGTEAGAVDSGMDLSAVVERLDRIEGLLARETALTPGGALRGTGTASGEGMSAAGDSLSSAQVDAIVAKLSEKLGGVVQENVKASMKEAIEDSTNSIALPEITAPKKKKMTLAEAAAELELTGEEEEAVRRIANETTDEFFKLLADKDNPVEDIRREFEDAKNDPEKRGRVQAKYMTKALSNIGGLISVGLNWQQKMNKAVGAVKTGKIERGYKLTDLDPYGLEDMFEGLGG